MHTLHHRVDGGVAQGKIEVTEAPLGVNPEDENELWVGVSGCGCV